MAEEYECLAEVDANCGKPIIRKAIKAHVPCWSSLGTAGWENCTWKQGNAHKNSAVNVPCSTSARRTVSGIWVLLIWHRAANEFEMWLSKLNHQHLLPTPLSFKQHLGLAPCSSMLGSGYLTHGLWHTWTSWTMNCQGPKNWDLQPQPCQAAPTRRFLLLGEEQKIQEKKAGVG